MSTSENKGIVLRRWYQELWDSWKIEVADELFAPQYVLHATGVPTPMNRDVTKQVVAMYSQAFPDLKHTIHEMIAEGDTVAARWTVNGTHRGAFQGLSATGRQVSLSGTTIHHMSQGKIVETWLTVDNLELLQQLGAAPKPG